MDQSYSESDVSLSPSQILEKLEMLRQLQLMQRGKLHKQRLDYQSSAEISANITEIVSHFTNSTTYNTFRSLLESTEDTSQEGTPRDNVRELSSKNYQVQNNNDKYPAVEGVEVLNISQESEYIPNSPISSRSTTSISKNFGSNENCNNSRKDKKHISLDEMPILSPKKNFEELIVEKLKNESPMVKCDKIAPSHQKKQFLKRGEGMARFGVRKNDLIIQNTKSLPWRKKSKLLKPVLKPNTEKMVKNPEKVNENINVQIIVPENKISKLAVQRKNPSEANSNDMTTNDSLPSHNTNTINNCVGAKEPTGNLETNINLQKVNIKKSSVKERHPILSNKGKSWAAVLTKEQNDFLSQLKQCEYYKNFGSPAKSIDTDTSCCDSISNVRNFKELAEQNLFDLIENKVLHESFSIENSFFNRFIKNNNLECSGESTPLVMQKCLSANPSLMRLAPELAQRKRNINSYSEDETCLSECTECNETCSSISTCCSCKSTVNKNRPVKLCNQEVSKTEPECQKKRENNNDEVCQNDTDKDTINSNMAEMNAKLVATSELLKERLHELEDEIETFRKENSSISKMREEIDLERQKFYEEKAKFEQKFNEEKILSEYYLAEEKEKLTKQKQMYERYVRDMRGRLNKKEKDEVITLKNEINNLKEEIRLKDAKSTSTIARLRNQIKLMEKDKKALEEQIEKLKKENKRILHSNDVTRRLTNIKYLEQINKNLANMSSKDSRSDVGTESNSKYKTFEIEYQKNLRKPAQIRTRAKSVPNLNVTSKYAKYFSQKDSISDKLGMSAKLNTCASEDDIYNETKNQSDNRSNDGINDSDNDDSYLEKMYNERFKSASPTSKRSSGSSTIDSPSNSNVNKDTNGFFLQKSNSVSSNKKSLSPHPLNSSSGSNKQSDVNLHQKTYNYSNECNTTNDFNVNHSQFGRQSKSQSRTKSPVSILSNHSSNSQQPSTIIYNGSTFVDKRMIPSPEPIISKTSLTKTSLNPTEIRKSDGTKELRFPNGNVKLISADGKYSKFIYYNGDIKENFYDEGKVKYFYSESKTYHTTHHDGLEVLEFPDGQIEKRYKDGSSEIRLPNGSIRYFDPKNDHVREDWRFPDGTSLTVSVNGEKRIIFPNGQIEVHNKDHKRREFPDGTVKLVYGDGTSETRYSSGRVRIKDKHGNLIMDSASKIDRMHNF